MSFLYWGPRIGCRIDMWFHECEWALMSSGRLFESWFLAAPCCVLGLAGLCGLTRTCHQPVGTVARLGFALSLGGVSVPCPVLGHSAQWSLGFWPCSASSSPSEAKHLSVLGPYLHHVCAGPQAASSSPHRSAGARGAPLTGSGSLQACRESHRAPQHWGEHPPPALLAWCCVCWASCSPWSMAQ